MDFCLKQKFDMHANKFRLQRQWPSINMSDLSLLPKAALLVLSFHHPAITDTQTKMSFLFKASPHLYVRFHGCEKWSSWCWWLLHVLCLCSVPSFFWSLIVKKKWVSSRNANIWITALMHWQSLPNLLEEKGFSSLLSDYCSPFLLFLAWTDQH